MTNPSPTPRSPHVIILNGGPPPSPRIRSLLASPAFVIGVDSGYAHADLLSLRCDELIGDFESLDERSLARAYAAGVVVTRFDTAKDATDLELAMNRAHELNAQAITVVCGVGWDNRFDHLAAQLGLLASPSYANVRITAWFGETFVAAVHDGGSLTVPGRPGQTISLLAVGSELTGVTTTGLRYPLHDENLSPYSTRSISNEFDHSEARISIRSGALLVIVPDAL